MHWPLKKAAFPPLFSQACNWASQKCNAVTDSECGLDCNKSIFKLAPQLEMVFSRSEKHLFSLNWLSINQSVSPGGRGASRLSIIIKRRGHVKQNVLIQLIQCARAVIE